MIYLKNGVLILLAITNISLVFSETSTPIQKDLNALVNYKLKESRSLENMKDRAITNSEIYHLVHSVIEKLYNYDLKKIREIGTTLSNKEAVGLLSKARATLKDCNLSARLDKASSLLTVFFNHEGEDVFLEFKEGDFVPSMYSSKKPNEQIHIKAKSYELVRSSRGSKFYNKNDIYLVLDENLNPTAVTAFKRFHNSGKEAHIACE